MIVDGLDLLTCGGFVPYRDSMDRVRLLDLKPPPRTSKAARALYRVALVVVEEGLRVTDEESYRAWYSAHGEPFYIVVSDAMRSLGVEGSELACLSSKILTAVHRPGWKCAP